MPSPDSPSRRNFLAALLATLSLAASAAPADPLPDDPIIPARSGDSYGLRPLAPEASTNLDDVEVAASKKPTTTMDSMQEDLRQIARSLKAGTYAPDESDQLFGTTPADYLSRAAKYGQLDVVDSLLDSSVKP